MLEAGKKVKYKGEDNWAFTKGETYTVEGYDRELDAWAVRANNDEIYAVAEDDLEEVK